MSNDQPIVRQWEYKPKPGALMLAVLFFAACGAYFVHKAITTEVGLIINGIIEMGPTGATIFYGALATVSLAFVVVAATIWFARSGKSPQRIAITDTSLIMPRSMWRDGEVEIPLAEIEGLSILTIHGQRFIEVIHRGQKHTINATWLPEKRQLDEVSEILASRIARD